MSIKLFPQQILKINLYLIFFLLSANIIGIISKYYFNHDYIYGLIPLFDFDTENNIPTLYSSISLIVVSLLLLFIAFLRKKVNLSFIPWLGLSIIFLFLSIDEIASIHERLASPSREIFKTSGLLYFAWVIPYGIALIVFIIAYLKFLIELPRNIMILFLISGTIFISGAIGFELLGGRQYELYGPDNILYSIFYTSEEFLEMLGIALFTYTLLTYLVSQFKFITITVSRK